MSLKIYNSYDENELDFDFYSTDPPVFRIKLHRSNRRITYQATATFRYPDGGSPYIYSVTAEALTGDGAMDKLLDILEERFLDESEA